MEVRGVSIGWRLLGVSPAIPVENGIVFQSFVWYYVVFFWRERSSKDFACVRMFLFTLHRFLLLQKCFFTLDRCTERSRFSGISMCLRNYERCEKSLACFRATQFSRLTWWWHLNVSGLVSFVFKIEGVFDIWSVFMEPCNILFSFRDIKKCEEKSFRYFLVVNATPRIFFLNLNSCVQKKYI